MINAAKFNVNLLYIDCIIALRKTKDVISVLRTQIWPQGLTDICASKFRLLLLNWPDCYSVAISWLINV